MNIFRMKYFKIELNCDCNSGLLRKKYDEISIIYELSVQLFRKQN